jgi:serine/threonine protein kinase
VTSASNPHALAPGTRVRDYTIVSVIGTGGFSIVYRALDNALMREVALKEYFPTMFAARADDRSIAPFENDVDVFRKGIESFLNEAKLLAQFDHPALVRVYRFWEENKTAYLAMRLYEGDTLREAVKSKRFLADEANMRALFSPICDTLELLHNAKCFHRDVAPDNILLSENGLPVLLDFGAARRAIEGTQVFTAILKPGFAPIEQYGESDLKQGPWTDIYALAGVMHYALAGHPPPTAINRMLKDAMPRPRVTFEGEMPEPWLDALEKALAVRPENRPQSIAEFRAMLGWDKPLVARLSVPEIAPSKASKIEDPDATVVAFRKPSRDAADAPALVSAPAPAPAPATAAIAPPKSATPAVTAVPADDEANVTVIADYALTVLQDASARATREPRIELTLADQRVPSMPERARNTTDASSMRWLPKAIVGVAVLLIAVGVIWQFRSSPKLIGPESPSTTITPTQNTVVTPIETAPSQKSPLQQTNVATPVRVESENPSSSSKEPAVTAPTVPTSSTASSKASSANKSAAAKRNDRQEIEEIDENGEPVVRQKKRTRPSRCTALIEAFQLGNTLSDDDQNFFQENCR